MSIGSYSHPQVREEYLQKRLNAAKEKIRELKTLSEAVANFSQFDPKKGIRNPLVFIAAAAKYDVGYKMPNARSEAILNQLDADLNFIMPYLSRETKTYLISRLRSNEHEQVLSALSEIVVIMHFMRKFGAEKITIEPKLTTGRKPELKFSDGSSEVYVEQTNVDLGVTDRKLEEIFTEASRAVWSEIKDSIIVNFEIDTSRLSWDSDGSLDIEQSTNLIIQSIKNLNLAIFFHNYGKHFSLENLTRISTPEKKLIETKSVLPYYGDMGELLSEKISQEPFKSFCETVTVRDLAESPVAHFYSVPAYYPLVEMSARGIFPSESALAERDGFVNRIIRSVKKKIEVSQRVVNKPNLLFVKAQNWTVHGYSTDRNAIIADLEFNHIETRITEFLEQAKVNDLSAVIIYEDSPSHGRIIINKYAKGDAVLSLDYIKKLIISK